MRFESNSFKSELIGPKNAYRGPKITHPDMGCLKQFSYYTCPRKCLKKVLRKRSIEKRRGNLNPQNLFSSERLSSGKQGLRL